MRATAELYSVDKCVITDNVGFRIRRPSPHLPPNPHLPSPLQLPFPHLLDLRLHHPFPFPPTFGPAFTANVAISPTAPGHGKELANLAKTYTENTKYNGESDSFTFRMTMFHDVCVNANISHKTKLKAFSTMLKRLALDYYFSNINTIGIATTFDEVRYSMRAYLKERNINGIYYQGGAESPSSRWCLDQKTKGNPWRNAFRYWSRISVTFKTACLHHQFGRQWFALLATGQIRKRTLSIISH